MPHDGWSNHLLLGICVIASVFTLEQFCRNCMHSCACGSVARAGHCRHVVQTCREIQYPDSWSLFQSAKLPQCSNLPRVCRAHVPHPWGPLEPSGTLYQTAPHPEFCHSALEGPGSLGGVRLPRWLWPRGLLLPISWPLSFLPPRIGSQTMRRGR